MARKMVFVGGPRQVGKTTLAKAILENRKTEGLYLNWDFDEHRRRIMEQKWETHISPLIFDELHKFPRWKNWLKGIYDVTGHRHDILVTGSARLDVYRRGGDSLLGRYHYWRLHPFTLNEIPGGIKPSEAFQRLMRFGGFPEPFLDADERAARRWRRERFDRVLREDVRDLENIRNIQLLRMLIDLLRTRVGGSIVVSNLATDLQVSPNTVKSWLELLERMYLIFLVRPHSKSIPRAIQKPPKVYFYDNADVDGDEGAKLENLVATHLLKQIQFLEDRDGFRYDLRYIRDKEGREVDFVVTKEENVEMLIEVKLSDTHISKPLQYYCERLQPRAGFQIVASNKSAYDRGRIKITGPVSFFQLPFFSTCDSG